MPSPRGEHWPRLVATVLAPFGTIIAGGRRRLLSPLQLGSLYVASAQQGILRETPFKNIEYGKPNTVVGQPRANTIATGLTPCANSVGLASLVHSPLLAERPAHGCQEPRASSSC